MVWSQPNDLFQPIRKLNADLFACVFNGDYLEVNLKAVYLNGIARAEPFVEPKDGKKQRKL
jgi:hypothetical protein